MHRLLRALSSYASTVFALDLRSLAAARIALGVLIVVDAVVRVRDATMFYSDDGLTTHLPLLQSLYPLPRPGLYSLSGSPAFATALLVVTALVGVIYVLGYRTRLVAVLAYILVLSVQNRCDYVNTGADGVFIQFLLFACFLPMGARFSLDARRAHLSTTTASSPTSTSSQSSWLSAASVAWVAQILLIYFFNVVNKNGHTWEQGTAVWQALSIDEHATPVGVWIREHLRVLMKPLTWGTLVVEFTMLLLLVPGRRQPAIRLTLVVLFWALHLGFALCFYLALFSPTCMAAWLGLLPAFVWERGPLRRLSAPAPASPAATADATTTTTTTTWLPRLGRGAVAVFLFVILAGQAGMNAGHRWGFSVPGAYQVLRPLRANSLWKMFAPNPGRNDGWWIVDGARADGSHIDVARPGHPKTSKKKPPIVADMYPTGRWRKFMMTISEDKQGGMRRRLVNHLCRSYNATHTGPEHLDTITLTFMLEVTPRNFESKDAKAKPKDFGTFVCPPEGAPKTAQATVKPKPKAPPKPKSPTTPTPTTTPTTTP